MGGSQSGATLHPRDVTGEIILIKTISRAKEASCETRGPRQTDQVRVGICVDDLLFSSIHVTQLWWPRPSDFKESREQKSQTEWKTSEDFASTKRRQF